MLEIGHSMADDLLSWNDLISAGRVKECWSWGAEELALGGKCLGITRLPA